MNMRSSIALGGLLAAIVLAACAKSSQNPSPSTPSTTMAPVSPIAAAIPSSAPTTAVAFTDISGIFAEQAIRDEAALGAFGPATGEFKPHAPISRGDFVSWLVVLHNVYYKADPTTLFRLPETGDATFVDVPATSPYFKYVQALTNAGFVVGVDDKHFAPNRPLTREEMIFIKASVDEGGKIVTDQNSLNLIGDFLSDGRIVNTRYVGAVFEDMSVRTTANMTRTFGKITALHPRQAVTRSEAAVCLARISAGSAAASLGRTQ